MPQVTKYIVWLIKPDYTVWGGGVMGFGNNVDKCVNNFNKKCKWPKVPFLATLFIQIF